MRTNRRQQRGIERSEFRGSPFRLFFRMRTGDGFLHAY